MRESEYPLCRYHPSLGLLVRLDAVMSSDVWVTPSGDVRVRYGGDGEEASYATINAAIAICEERCLPMYAGDRTSVAWQAKRKFFRHLRGD